MRILLVEDDPAVSHSIALMLRSDAFTLDMTDLARMRSSSPGIPTTTSSFST